MASVTQNSLPGVSVIVCCYNSATRLPETLKHLAMQQVPSHIPWEVIVVDNASTDETAEVALNEWKKYQSTTDFYIVEESRPGLSYARLKGMLKARFNYLLYCDDDNWLFPDYVSVAFGLINADDKIGVLGGCGIFEPEKPTWQNADKYKSAYVNGPQIWAEIDHWVYGAGSVYRKNVLLRLYQLEWHQIVTGRKGKKLISGEDVEICFMYHLAGYKIIADERLKFRHFVPLKRQNIEYIEKLHYWQSYSYILLSGYLSLINKDTRPLRNVLIGSTLYHFKKIAFTYCAIWNTILFRTGKERVSLKKQITISSGALNALLTNGPRIIAQRNLVINLLKELTENV